MRAVSGCVIDGSTGWKEHRGAVRSELPHRGRPHNDRWLRGLVEVELNEGLGNTGDDSYRCLTTVLQHGEPGCGLAWKLARGKARERGGKTRQDASWRWLDSSYILLDASWNTIVPESFGLCGDACRALPALRVRPPLSTTPAQHPGQGGRLLELYETASDQLVGNK